MSKGMSLAFLNEVCISSLIEEVDLKEILTKNKERKKLVAKNFSKQESMGFGFGR